MTATHTIAIVGAGLCGSVLATRLLRRPPAAPTRIVLVERSGEFGRGVAYARRDHDYLLNVPAGRMSADSGDALEFLLHARGQYAHADAEDFLPRACYGDYLGSRLGDAEKAAPAHVQLERRHATVLAVKRTGRDAPLRVGLDDGDSIIADQAVLCVGNSQPAQLPPLAAIADHPAYHADPWRVPAAFRPGERVLVVGTGLTMVDVATAAFERTSTPAIMHAVSRHGLVPPSQTAFRPDALQADGCAVLLAAAPSSRRMLRAVRTLVGDAEAAGGDWREAITFVRRVAPTLWQRMPLTERRRFLRHARAQWDAHRHRLPAENLARIDALRSSGRLDVIAARLQGTEAIGDQLRVTLCRRGGEAVERLHVDRVINCTGPDYDVRRLTDALWRQLRADGLVVSDEIGLGLRTGPDGAVVDTDGWPGPRLFYLGPMLRADHWEATGAVELRDHAERLADRLVRGVDQR